MEILKLDPDPTFIDQCREGAAKCIESGNKTNADRAIYLVNEA